MVIFVILCTAVPAGNGRGDMLQLPAPRLPAVPGGRTLPHHEQAALL
jgi:hypothetical protein